MTNFGKTSFRGFAKNPQNPQKMIHVKLANFGKLVYLKYNRRRSTKS